MSDLVWVLSQLLSKDGQIMVRLKGGRRNSDEHRPWTIAQNRRFRKNYVEKDFASEIVGLRLKTRGQKSGVHSQIQPRTHH